MRVLAACVLYVPEAQGSLPRGATPVRTSRRYACTAYRGATGAASALLLPVPAHEPGHRHGRVARRRRRWHRAGLRLPAQRQAGAAGRPVRAARRRVEGVATAHHRATRTDHSVAAARAAAPHIPFTCGGASFPPRRAGESVILGFDHYCFWLGAPVGLRTP